MALDANRLSRRFFLTRTAWAGSAALAMSVLGLTSLSNAKDQAKEPLRPGTKADLKGKPVSSPNTAKAGDAAPTAGARVWSPTGYETPLQQPRLPYAQDALAPHISQRTVNLHFEKHHAGYFDTARNLVKGTPMAKQSLEALMVATAGSGEHKRLFNNTAQAWNHIVYWNGMRQGGGGDPKGDLLAGIKKDFGGVAQMKQALASEAMGVFGSGWAWLVLGENNRLEVMGTPNGDNPLVHGKRTLMGLDVWEHSYYLDYQNRRGDYVNAFLDHLVDWTYVARNYEAALKA